MNSPAARVALVTGGTGGLGRAIVSRLLADGMRVVSADLRTDPVGPEDDRLRTFAVDVTDTQSVETLVARVRAQWGTITVLVNNAGIAGPSAAVTDYPPEEWRRVLDVNLTGTFHCMRACLPAMIAAGYGRIVNVASIAGKEGNPRMSAYSASKAGVIALTKSAAKETATTGVLVNCVVPGVIESGLTEAASEEERRLFVSRVPMGRMGRAEELAELISWLTSERCSFSTGAAYDLSGGRAVY
ncbi:MAG: SDR family NAD(P)-dependent oxidoreductase [Solirubrobacteraceae bacterium]